MIRKRILTVLLTAAVLITGLWSVFTIHDLQGNARAINYTGVVRGAVQRLVKQELNGTPDDQLIGRLDGILEELATGRGENGLIRLKDSRYQQQLAQMQKQWEKIKAEILLVREGKPGDALYRASEAYFDLADRTVKAAEIYTERKVRGAEQGLILLNVVILLFAALTVWYGMRQNRRQRQLQEAEEANRARSESLKRMSRDLLAPMDEIPELIYVADTADYELLFLNDAGRKAFGEDSLDGRKCYQVLQGRDAPCDFCTTPFLAPGENYTWEFTNPITNRHYLLKDRQLEWEGRPARLEIAIDITEAEEEKQALKYTLDAQQMLMECVRTLYREQDMERSVPALLERLGDFLAADRSYLGLVREQLLYNDYEWCREGIESQKEKLQGSPLTAIESWLPAFGRQECYILEDIDTLRESHPEEYELLHGQNIKSLVAAPLEQDGELKGLLGVDNPPPERIRSVASLLQTLSYFLLLAYRRTESARQLSQLSYCDTLTSFYNRNRFIRDSGELSGGEGAVGVVYLDVNGLKDINDRYGHAVGDKVLSECARQMREVFGEADHYRIGGDEFVILCPGIGRKEFERRVQALRGRFGTDSLYHAAIGAHWSGQRGELQQLIAQADGEMYEDKKEFYRKNPTSHRYRHLSDAMLRLSDPEVLEDEIRQNHFVVYLQPKISSDRCTVGAEALVRYRPDSGSLVLPGNFLPLLEEYRTVSQIDFYVFEFACSRLKDWAARGKETLPVSVNFSRCSLAQPDFVERLSKICAKYGVDKKYLGIELTETAREAGLDVKALIEELRQEGFIVSIDDFGTEYANLSLLSAVEFDVLKLDKSLLDDVAVNPRARAVVASIVEVCGKMNIEVVAEGIETEEQFEALRGCGVKLAQGFLFSEPVPMEEYEERYL